MTSTITLTKKEVEEAREDAKSGGGCMFFLMVDGECNPTMTVPHTPLCRLCKKLTEFARGKEDEE